MNKKLAMYEPNLLTEDSSQSEAKTLLTTFFLNTETDYLFRDSQTQILTLNFVFYWVIIMGALPEGYKLLCKKMGIYAFTNLHKPAKL